jgi:polar amino acid transport system permease protein
MPHIEIVIDTELIRQTWKLFAAGLWVTLQVSFFALLIAVPLGVLLGLGRVSRNRVVRGVCMAYVEFVRGIPLIVLLLWIYFGVGNLLPLGGEQPAAIYTLGLFSAAFVAEIVRSGIQAVPRGQAEAARSSGMTYLRAMRYVVLPQALRTTLPPLAGQFILLIKDSSLVSIISVNDLTLVAKNLVASTAKSMEIYTALAVLYFVLTFVLARLVRLLEKRYAKGGHA